VTVATGGNAGIFPHGENALEMQHILSSSPTPLTATSYGSSSEGLAPTQDPASARTSTVQCPPCGCSSILVLLPIVEVADTMQWGEGSAVEEALSIVDCDIAAALENAKEEVRYEGEAGVDAAIVLRKLKGMLEGVEEKVELWGGDFPFGRSLDALNGIELWSTVSCLLTYRRLLSFCVLSSLFGLYSICIGVLSCVLFNKYHRDL
jgi:hypothetical protein